MNDRDNIVLWLVGFILLVILAIFTAPLLIEAAIGSGITLGERLSN